MYDIAGDFGQVRHVTIPLHAHPEQDIAVPFHIGNAGWHSCNSLYRITRSQGKSGHLLLFSVSDGGMLQFEDQPPVKIPPASAAWICAGRSHSYYVEPGKTWEFYWLDVPETDDLPFFTIFTESEILPLTHISEIAGSMEQLLQNQFPQRQAFLLEASRLISNIYHALLSERISSAYGQRQDVLILDIVQKMQSHYDWPWDLQELSQIYFISVPHLIRRFKAATGMPPHTYLMTLRLRAAKLYLQHTNRSIDEISRKTGFSCASNFIRQFRTHYQVTPKSYRNSKRIR